MPGQKRKEKTRMDTPFVVKKLGQEVVPRRTGKEEGKEKRNKKRGSASDMSRVRVGQKYVNTSKYPSSVTGPPKIERMISKKRKDELRAEYTADTGREVQTKKRNENDWDDVWDEEDEKDYDYWVGYLAETGGPISPDGTPLGIGWDD